MKKPKETKSCPVGNPEYICAMAATLFEKLNASSDPAAPILAHIVGDEFQRMLEHGSAASCPYLQATVDLYARAQEIESRKPYPQCRDCTMPEAAVEFQRLVRLHMPFDRMHEATEVLVQMTDYAPQQASAQP